MFLLFKKGDPQQPENYRGISLMYCITKLFTQLLSNRLADWLEYGNPLIENQNGFRKSRGCIDNIFSLSALISSQIIRDKRKVFATFVDFRKAFDSVDHNLLWHKLYSYGIRRKLIKVLSNLYSITTTKIRTFNSCTDDVAVSRGVLQGDSISPLLFAIFIDDLDRFLQDNSCDLVHIDHTNGISSLLYADDVVCCQIRLLTLRGSYAFWSDTVKLTGLKLIFRNLK